MVHMALGRFRRVVGGKILTFAPLQRKPLRRVTHSRTLLSMAEHLETGALGEQLACQWLEGHGYRVMHRNWRHGRDELDIVARKDSAALRGVLGQPIEYSFGGGQPTADGFFAFWKAKSGHEDLWRELGWVLRHGGTFGKDGSFQAPYISSCWPDGLDPFKFGAIAGADVRVRSLPQASAPVVGAASYDIVTILDHTRKDGYCHIRLQGGGEGWVSQDYLGSPVDYRAFFKRAAGQWKMTTFLAGD